jgi:hypothetical protein
MRAARLLFSSILVLIAGVSAVGNPNVASTQKIVMPPGLDVASAMNALYGNFDKVEQVSFVAKRPSGTFVSSLFHEGSVFATPLYGRIVQAIGGEEFIFLTYSVPTLQVDGSFHCHGCAPLIGMAVFNKSGDHWKIEAFSDPVIDAGEFGNPPEDIRTVKIGPGRWGVEIKDTGSGNGYSSTSLDLLVPWNGAVGLAIERIIADDNAGVCGNKKGEEPCYSNRRSISFLQDKVGHFYDLELTLSGTDRIVDSPYTNRSVRGVERLRFENGKYVRVYRHGDQIFLDDWVAEREGLK